MDTQGNPGPAPESMDNLIQKATDLLQGRGRLLFLTRFGSDLYGTRVEGISDTDVRGVFLPMTAPATLEEACMQRGVHSTTGTAEHKNGPRDEDMDLFPLERWLCQMLPLGNTGALDLLYAPTNPSCTLYCHPAMKEVFDSPLTFLNLSNGTGCLAYCQGQGKSYGMAGTRLGVLYRVLRLLEGEDGRKRLEDVAEDIVARIATPQYCKLAEDRGLVLAEQCHMGRTRVDEVIPRLQKTLQPNMERIELARQNRDIDWKAMSHAVRAIRQQEELLRTGSLHYPLACAQELLRIKKGEYTFAEVEKLVSDGLAGLEEMRRHSTHASSPDFEQIFAKARAVRRLCSGQG